MCKYVSCNLRSVGFMRPLTSAAKGRNRPGDSATLFFFLFQHSGQLLKKTWSRPNFSCIILMETFLLLPSSSWLWPPEQTDSDKKQILPCDGRKESVEHVSFQSLPSWTLCQRLRSGSGRRTAGSRSQSHCVLLPRARSHGACLCGRLQHGLRLIFVGRISLKMGSRIRNESSGSLLMSCKLLLYSLMK